MVGTRAQAARHRGLCLAPRQHHPRRPVGVQSPGHGVVLDHRGLGDVAQITLEHVGGRVTTNDALKIVSDASCVVDPLPRRPMLFQPGTVQELGHATVHYGSGVKQGEQSVLEVAIHTNHYRRLDRLGKEGFTGD